MFKEGPSAKLAIIGGSGFYNMDGLSELEEWDPKTPFGKTSDTIVIGTMHKKRVAFIPRHGRGHQLLPQEIPARANIWALKVLGVEGIIAVSAVGSLRKEIAPQDMVVPDQIIDRTRHMRPTSFFGNGIVAHVGFADLRTAIGGHEAVALSGIGRFEMTFGEPVKTEQQMVRQPPLLVFANDRRGRVEEVGIDEEVTDDACAVGEGLGLR